MTDSPSSPVGPARMLIMLTARGLGMWIYVPLAILMWPLYAFRYRHRSTPSGPLDVIRYFDASFVWVFSVHILRIPEGELERPVLGREGPLPFRDSI